VVREWGGRVVMVYHGSAALDAAAWPGPVGLYAAGLRRWYRHAYATADGVMAACEPHGDTGRHADVPLRFGLHPAFRPQPGVARGDHILYAGRLAREKGLLDLVDACARSGGDWRIRLVGNGPAESLVLDHARRAGIAHRIERRPFLASPEA